ncbi:FtsW/RodA/SpoVE family cell cycle protein [Halobacillus sp. ACCC02827]|uniref:FtsW/RodA/SpoVE family cell cycle protein n=1 Tax=Bacillaceae TaxID=186817 RepID=UPI0002A51961|nr:MULTISPECIES: FtsW/RodA/SpoVE family cell cycle protein [Bacillaceae]ELK47777.1 Cell division protein, FtsW/RodA/SpoVE [Halobacillus sp. BAB-2008]QHT45461.1 FtsW/RodA/SpoVE family cell cycle protein [Bacillus sp. SB49]WJE16257.1 FtsW/RodA/SpoVE family cell cycle protein [Halobacillus sp. ACCC02827]
MTTKASYWEKLDQGILCIIVSFFVISVVFIYSSQNAGVYSINFAGRQVINYAIGVTLMLIVAKLDIDQIERLAWPLYIGSFASVFVLRWAPPGIAPVIYGAKRWFNIPLIGSIQPSEFLKISLFILTASILATYQAGKARTIWTDIRMLGKLMLLTVPPALFVYQQPDTGMVILYFIGIGSMIFLSNISKRILAVLVIVPVVLLVSVVTLFLYQPEVMEEYVLPLLKPHQQDRIVGFLDPSTSQDQSYQSHRAQLAAGSGQFTGKGLMNGEIYIPEKHTDFIFAAIAEEGGFIAATIVVLLFFLLIYKFFKFAEETEVFFGTCLMVSIAVSMSAQIFQNIGMVIGLMPVKGIALPFITYGGSSLFSTMMMVGIALSLRKNHGKYMFSN